MACSLPIIMSDFYYQQEIFEECALFANPSDPKDIADKIIYLLNNPNKIRKLGDRGRELIKEKYNWEAESKKLIILYNSFIK
jgi:glycosyltransferase involved in cell wall biosynthesis